jgi:hypothetical protein
MKQDNPFAKLGALDQKLYQDTAPKPVQENSHPTTPPDPVVIKPNTRDNHKKPANPQAGKILTSPTRAITEKPKKYTTRLRPGLVKRLRLYAIEHDMNDYEVIQDAVIEYIKIDK